MTAFVILILIVSSSLSYYSTQQRMLNMQYDASKKLLTQMNYNIQTMNDIIKNMAITTFNDDDLISLKYGSTMEQVLVRTEKLNKIVTFSPYLHSILFYNGKMNRFFSSINHNGNNAELQSNMESLLLDRDGAALPKLKLLPISFHGSGNGSVDVFSVLMYDGAAFNGGNQSALILNIKPEWLLTNLRDFNQLEEKPNNAILLLDSEGRSIIQSNADSLPQQEIRSALLREIADSSEALDHFTYKASGQKYMVTYLTRGLNDWKIVSIQSYEDVLGSVHQLRWTLLLSTLLLIVVAVVLSFIISLRLYKPIAKLLHLLGGGSMRGDGGGQASSMPMKDEMSYIYDVYSHLYDKVKGAEIQQASYQHMAQSYVLRSLVTDSGSMPKAEFEAHIKQHNLRIAPEGAYAVIVIKLDRESELNGRQRQDAPLELLRFALMNIADEILSRNFRSQSIDMPTNHVVLLVSLTAEAKRDELPALLRETQEVVKRYYGITFTAALSDAFDRHEEVTSHYTRTLRNVNYRLLFGRQALIHPEMVAKNELNRELHIPSALEKSIVEGVKGGDLKELQEGIDGWIDHIARYNYDNMRSALLHLVVILNNTLGEMNRNLLNPIEIDWPDTSQSIFEQETLEDVRETFMKVYQDIVGKSQGRGNNRSKILVDTIKEIISKHYMDPDLNVQKLSQMLKMSHAYLGQMFKEREGESIVDHINDVRLLQARLLLELRDINVNEIMEAVGFGNQSYFYRLFKRKYGTTPKEYRLKKVTQQKD